MHVPAVGREQVSRTDTRRGDRQPGTDEPQPVNTAASAAINTARATGTISRADSATMPSTIRIIESEGAARRPTRRVLTPMALQLRAAATDLAPDYMAHTGPP